MASKSIDSSYIAWFVLMFLFWLLMFPVGSHAGETKNVTVQKLNQKVRTNSKDLEEQKTLLESNSVKLYETLIKLELLDKQSVKYSDDLKSQDGKFESIESRLNREYEKQILDTVNASGFWVFIATMLVFLMPIGFIAFESGQITKEEIASAGMKHLIAWAMVFLVYYVIGFGVMFGESQSGFVGSTLIFLTAPDSSVFFTSELDNNISPAGFLFYQIAFTMTAVLVVSTALHNQLSMGTYGFIGLIIGGLVYPLYGHWAWASHLLPENHGWLENLGFVDFAGSTVVHSLAAWFALVWAYGIKINPETIKAQVKVSTKSSHSLLIYSFIGVFILWFGWIGMVAGNHLQFDSEVILLALKVSLSGASAGIAASLLGVLWAGKNASELNVIGAVIGGFVAVSAACEVILPLEAIVIGGVAGVMYPIIGGFLKSTLLSKDYQAKAAGVISAHGFCGVWGTLSVALFGSEGLYLFDTDMDQLMIQLKGVLAAFFFSIISAYICLLVYRIFSNLASNEKEV